MRIRLLQRRSTYRNQENMVSQRENDNPIASKFKGMEYCDLNNKEFKIALREKINKLKKTQKDNSMKSEIKLINRRDSSPKRL